MSLEKPSLEHARRKRGLITRVALLVLTGAALLAFRPPLWAVALWAVFLAVVAGFAVLEWRLLTRSAPLLPMADALSAKVRDLPHQHLRVFERTGGEATITCEYCEGHGGLTFLLVDAQDRRSLSVEAATGDDSPKAVATKIMMQRGVVTSGPIVLTADGGTDAPLSPAENFKLIHMNYSSGVLHPSPGDLDELLRGIDASDSVRDFPSPGH